jgi:predicted TIM-barrel fold metal-dependent hydrolase
VVPDIEVLLPHLEPYWRDYITVRGVRNLDPTSYPNTTPLASRPDWRDESGRGGVSLECLQRDVFDGLGASQAILNCVWGAQGLHHAHLAAALCGAVNSWLAEAWLDRDDRLRASIVIPWQSAELAVAEIEKRAEDARFIQVLLPGMTDMLYGRERYWPIYEAAQRHGLPIGIHAGSVYRYAPTSLGYPSYYVEDYLAQAPAMQNQLMSLVAEGVFTKFPELKVVFIESGVTWLPAFMWRANKIWRAMRMEVPWVERSPAEIIRQSVRFTLQPIDAPLEPERLHKVLDQIGTDRALLFSSDYPHHHFDGNAPLPAGLTPEFLERLLWENAVDTYPRLQGDRS